MGEHDPKFTREAKLFRNNRSQAVRIPADWEFEGDKVRITRDGNRLVLEPVQELSSLREFLGSLEPMDEDFEIPDEPPLEPTEDFLNRNFPLDDVEMDEEKAPRN